MSLFGWFRQRRQRRESVKRLAALQDERLKFARTANKAASESAQAAAANRLAAAEELRATIRQTLDLVAPRSQGHASR